MEEGKALLIISAGHGIRIGRREITEEDVTIGAGCSKERYGAGTDAAK